MAIRKRYIQTGTRTARAKRGGTQEVPIWRVVWVDTGKYHAREPGKR